ncbi:MAG: hypothetical protein RL557_587 [archaeon]
MQLLSVFIFIACISCISASITIFCSDNSKPLSDQQEISRGNYKTINGVSIGLIESNERVFYKLITADILIDVKRATLTNETSSETLQLVQGKYTVELISANATSATIEVDGEDETILLLETTQVKGIFAMLSELGTDEQGGTAKVMIGAEKISLSNKDNPAEKIEYKNKTYLLTLQSASTSNALIQVSTCNSGYIDFNLIEAGQNTSTDLAEESQTEEERIKEENEKNNASTVQVSVAEANAQKNNQTPLTNQTAGTDQSQTEGFFSKIWNWIKSWFKR